jgi:probable HAF family extracellular repeat protein
MRTKVASLVVCVAAALATTLISPRVWSAPPSFQGLGVSDASDLSADGSTVVGVVEMDGIRQAFRWARDGGRQLLSPSLPASSYIGGVSADGTTIIGSASNNMGFHEAFRWTAAGGMQWLGDLPGGAFRSGAQDVSEDGSVIVGVSVAASGEEAFRWTAADGMQGLGGSYSQAYDVSADGSAVIGFFNGNRAFRWTSANGMQDLGTGANSEESWLSGLSADGSVVVGVNSLNPFRWTSAGGLQDFGNVTFSPSAVSSDGSIIVGGSNRGAVIWDAANGVRRLQTLLAVEYGLDLADWELLSAAAVSADGRTIMGVGRHLSTEAQEAWIATIPEPSSLVLLGLGGIFAFLLRRKQVARMRICSRDI